MEGSKCSPVTWIAKILVIVGGLNWGLIAINYEWNVVGMLLGKWMVVERIVYGLVGLAALWMLVTLFTCCGSCKTEEQ
ncbi:DUF378 domain-containing protein [Candidatus Peregrinibacteria bacterium]|nr:DUF378 domain-containing protein [Candidatus Peregrinibacteria bacterium]